MSKRLYENLAKALSEARPATRASQYAMSQWLGDVAAVARVLLDLNPSFDVQRFLDNCRGKR